jgi:hypothetical protein
LRPRQTANNFQRHDDLHTPSTESSRLELNQRITHRLHPTCPKSSLAGRR